MQPELQEVLALLGRIVLGLDHQIAALQGLREQLAQLAQLVAQERLEE